MKELIARDLFPILTVMGQVGLLGVALASLNSVYKKSIEKFIKSNGLVTGFGVALVATLGSLFYSEVMGYNPCLLCWYQRIAMYPLVLLLGLAAYKKDNGMADYGFWLSVVGGVIALYHYLLQMGLLPSLICLTSGGCVTRFVFQYGYVTIPMMALTAFVIIAVLMNWVRRIEK